MDKGVGKSVKNGVMNSQINVKQADVIFDTKIQNQLKATFKCASNTS